MAGIQIGVSAPASGASAPAAAATPKKQINIDDVVFTNVEEASTGNGIKMLVYGPAGAGKTRFCGTAPKPLIISAEAGLLTFKKMIREGILDPKTPVVEIDTFHKLETTLEWCRQRAKDAGILTICLDSISEIAERCLSAERAKTKDPRQAYGGMADETIKTVKEFRDLKGFHVIVTAKETKGTDPVTGVTKAMPTAPGQQVGPALPYLFDEVFHAYTDKGPEGTYHALRTHAAFNAEAKDRSGVLDEVEWPDANHLINKILGAPQAA